MLLALNSRVSRRAFLPSREANSLASSDCSSLYCASVLSQYPNIIESNESADSVSDMSSIGDSFLLYDRAVAWVHSLCKLSLCKLSENLWIIMEFIKSGDLSIFQN